MQSTARTQLTPKINNDQWRVDTDGLSTFENPPFNTKATNKPCKIAFVIQGVGAAAAIPGPDVGVRCGHGPGNPLEHTHPTTGGPGHWSLNGPNNNIGFPDAITKYALDANNNVISVNEDYKGNSKSKCMKPDASNVVQRTAKRTSLGMKHRPVYRRSHRRRSHAAR